MLDPFPIPPPAWLQDLIRPAVQYLNIPTFLLHFHEILFASAFYHFIYIYVSPQVSRRLAPNVYPKFNRRTIINWNVHGVSLIQSLVICVLALYTVSYDEERASMNWAGRIWGYTGAMGLVQAMAGGYFIWDVIISVIHIDIFGVGNLAHAIAATVVFSFGFRPFLNYYGCTFVLYELSTPFLNIHWFLDKLKMTGGLVQWVNGIILILTFASCRIIWGLYNSVLVFNDVKTAWNQGGLVSSDSDPSGYKIGLDANVTAAVTGSSDPLSQLMLYAGDRTVPMWLAGSYLASNIVLNCLNMYWLSRMIETIRERFDPPFGTKGVREKEAVKDGPGKDPLVQRGLYEDGRKTVEIEGREVRSRRKG